MCLRRPLSIPEFCLSSAGHKFLLLSGYSSDSQPAARQQEAESSTSHVAGIHFVLATLTCDGRPVVLIGLTEEAALEFASFAHVVVTQDSGWQPLDSQVLSADAVRLVSLLCL